MGSKVLKGDIVSVSDTYYTIREYQTNYHNSVNPFTQIAYYGTGKLGTKERWDSQEQKNADFWDAWRDTWDDFQPNHNPRLAHLGAQVYVRIGSYAEKEYPYDRMDR